MLSSNKALSALGDQQKKYAIFIFVLMIFSMFFEALSIGIIIPLFSIFLKGELGTSFFSSFYLFGQFTGKNLIYFGLSITLIIFVIKNIFLIFSHWHQVKFVQTIYVEFTNRLFKNYLKKKYLFFLQTNTALLIRNVTDEIGSFTSYITHFMVFVSELLVFVGISIVLFYVDFLITSIVLLLVGIFTFFIYKFIKKRIAFYGKERIVLDGNITKHIIQGFTSIKDVKISGREDDFIYQLKQNVFKRGKLNIFINFINILPKLLFEILIVCTFVILVLFMLGTQREMTEILQYLGLFAVASFRIIPGASRIFLSFQALKYRQPSIKLLSSELFLAKNYSQKDNQSKYSNTPMQFQKQINLKNLCFSYPTRKEFSLSEISMTIKKGDFIGVVGDTGSGKSTLINLFIGLLKPLKGKIEVDEKDIFSNLPKWHKKIGYVPQSIYLTDDTIRKNIAFGLREEEIEDNLIKQAVEKANLSKFIKNLPEGLDTIVGEKGINISGGQLQRVGIARSLYHDPEILILDEATSSLDLSTEKTIMESVQLLKGKKTLIVVTHRLSTVEKCDKIFSINEGKITKQGSPQEVLENF